jgi:acyl carrier protein
MSSSVLDQAAFSAWCVSFVAEMLERAPGEINPDVKFSRIGFDSAMSVQLAVALEEQFGIRLDPDAIADHPTISKLAAYLAKRARETVGDESCLPSLR